MFRSDRIQSVLLASLITFCAWATPAHADDPTKALGDANQLLQQGIPVKAIELINETLKSGELPSDLAAKALLMRAKAQEKLGKYAYALADYNQALWQGLSDSDKGVAEEGRSRIMAKLGVGGGSGGSAEKTASSDGSSWGTQVKAQPASNNSGSENAFSNLFGSSQSSTSQESSSQTAQKAKPTRTAQQVNVVSVQDDASSPSASSNASGRGNEYSGDFAIQMAALHSEKGAIYEVDRIEKRYGEWLGGRTPSITIRPTSNGGTLYKVIAEPFKHGEGLATCELLKTKGLSCMLISR